VLDQERVAEIVERNPRVDRGAVERSRVIAQRLARFGIECPQYRLEPPLGGKMLENARRRVPPEQARTGPDGP
jgi:hypothetical protein